MQTLELKKTYKALYGPSPKKIELIDVPRLQFLMIDGAIEPGLAPGNSPLFQENVQALYGVAYTLKFTLKKRKEDPVDYPVMALEGLWWVEDGLFDITAPDNWIYTVMIMVPELITHELFGEAVAQLRTKKGEQPGFNRLRLDHFQEGLCVQTMHVGPYADEPATVQRMRLFAETMGCKDRVELGGKHHEIYLGNPQRADPAKLKTVVRHPVEQVN